MVNEISVSCYKNGTNVLPQRNSFHCSAKEAL
jgi:hypothetical protein